MIKVGLVGCGAIGTALAEAIAHPYAQHARLVGVHDLKPTAARHLAERLNPHPPILSLDTLCDSSQLVVEAASADGAGAICRRALQSGCHVLIMSVGALLHDPSLLAEATHLHRHIHIPSGALCGVDGLKAFAQGRLERVTLTTTKPPSAFAGAPRVAAAGVNLAALKQPTVLFEGTAQQAVEAFPQNINVAATLVLATRGTVPVHVTIVADPHATRNRHEVEAVGDCGRLVTRMESDPSATHPRTSEVALRSAVATLGQILAGSHIGT